MQMRVLVRVVLAGDLLMYTLGNRRIETLVHKELLALLWVLSTIHRGAGRYGRAFRKV